MSVIAIANQKGGVGKTTTAVNLAYWLAATKPNRKVCLIDFDMQGHAGRSLGIGKGGGLYRWLVDEQPLERCAETVRNGMYLDVVTSDKSTAKVKLHIDAQLGRELYIWRRLDKAVSQYDYVIMDLAPGSDVLHVGALIAADALIIPTRMDFLALDGTLEVIKTVQSLATLQHVEAPQLIGVLPTMYDRQTTETQLNLARLRETLGSADLVLPPIPLDTRIREATSRGLTIWEYAPGSTGAIGYAATSDAPNSRGRVGGYLHLGEIVERVA